MICDKKFVFKYLLIEISCLISKYGGLKMQNKIILYYKLKILFF